MRELRTKCGGLVGCAIVWAMRDTDSKGNNADNSYVRYLYLGFTLVLIISILVTGGFFIDKLLGTLPLFLLAGLAIGFAGGLYYVYLEIEKLGGG